MPFVISPGAPGPFRPSYGGQIHLGVSRLQRGRCLHQLNHAGQIPRRVEVDDAVAGLMGLALFLASPAAHYMTGSQIV